MKVRISQPQPTQLPLLPVSNLDTVKAFFKNSLTIFMARLTMFLGFITGVIGSLDLSPLATFDYTTDFKPKQLIGMAVGIVIGGVIFELSRRRTLA